ncbi:molybdopterin-guanine dinucleotide biosynthesis protein B [Campylobacter insulaenigrae]|uniref:Molybdenum cofactor guanylyltransferase protein B n=1 Tax=Campylobacter insulaenigrae NCTC 12927 TaxID=1031564 RepID=A0A0A8H1X1_9BACT|nr:molybdopterin-guanine dinucleotide biosynthesis protein B [Campylobacter insulaenigrae]AJC87670.1 molybdenum cofactor guanylyltransferase protein B [Campylobacter insulaenigrae NCTC 12927]MCR6573177.1 molybdopterin-guanine dinucleotide biosynthesis protein B [Campylobacter insulaenigrae]MCR6578897.1 molybdopterin-guanine dinucleotide biosynthesis protein B [Campylobacter insulaenigrae]MCR6579935.1 molybdopterin-guanine dinucleotide biosynthesis protein B [Campylobacter insulaenigrae]MCR6587
MKRLAMAFSGPSNSGKTTLITKVASYFMDQNFKVCIIKHDPGDKACFDNARKDSFKFFQSGADVMVLSPTRTTLFQHACSDLDKAVAMFDDFDFLFIEGLKTLSMPRISVFCKDVDEEYFDYSNAVASYKKIDHKNVAWLDLNDLEGICDFILKNSKKV